jgi:hypothetical protein
MRGIPLSAHSALEVAAAPVIMVAPILLGFGAAATAIAIALGVILLGHALLIDGSRRPVPLSTHAGLDYVLGALAASAGLAVGATTGEWSAGVFLVGVGAAQVTLTAFTRFSAPLRAR